MSRVLCLAAHPDDEILGVAGTLLRHKAQGDEVVIALAKECRPRSTQESYEAEARLGIPYRRWEDPERVVADVKPDIVYTHWRGDLNADHRWLHERVLVACRPYGCVKALYAFDTASSTEWGMEPFVPTRFVDIDATLERKLEAMAAYQSELRKRPHPRDLPSLEARAAYWGQVGGFEVAEAFVVVRERW